MAVVDGVRDLTKDEAAAFSRMSMVVHVKSRRNKLRSGFMEAKKRLDKIGFSIPPNMIDFQTPLGYCSKAVTVPSKRIRPDGFTLATVTDLKAEIDDILTDNYFAMVERMAIESSLEHSVAFIFATPGDTSLGEPKVIVAARTALEATAEVDARTNRVTAALEVVSANVKALLYLPGRTLLVERVGGVWKVTKEYTYNHKRVTCTPYVWGRSLKRPFGHSRISRPLMGFSENGVRTMLRMETNAEFFSAPQRALLGADGIHFKDEDGKPISPLSILIGSIWGIPDVKDPDTDEMIRPALEQLSQASMQPHSEMMRTIAQQVSSETSIPVSYLGVISDNPASADAIRAAESDLMAVIEGEFDSIGMSRTDLARNVAAVLHDEWTDGMEKDLRGLRARFLDPGTPTIAARADSGSKFATTFPDADPEVAMEMYGMNGSQIQRMLTYKNKLQGTNKLAAMVAAAKAPAVPVAPVVPAAGE